MKIVSDSTPLIRLAEIDSFYLLGKVFDKLYIPMAVYKEVVREGKGKPGEREVKEAGWIEIKKIKAKTAVRKLMKAENIHEGEAEAIQLAKELKFRFILIDEHRAYKVAESLGLKVIGTLEFLYIAKQRKLIPKIKDKLDILLARKIIKLDVYKKILRQAKEE